ncbi:MAG: GntR family transcriptional regulator [Candidatus Nanopelagicaceae bacterium]
MSLSKPPISQRSSVAHFLREQIISGEIKPGTQIKQNEIAENFKCSPGPVREAMRDLESEGLLEHIQNRGVFVASITNEEFLHMLLPVRLVLEQFALRNARAKFTPFVVKELQKQIEQMRAGTKLKSIEMVNEADVKFHTITMEVAASTQTIELWKSVLSRIRLEFYKFGTLPSLTKQASEHAALLEVLTTGSPAKIDEKLKWHIVESHSQISKKAKGKSVK